MTPRDLITLSASLLLLAEQSRAVPAKSETKAVRLERGVLRAAMTGLVPLVELDSVPVSAMTSTPRLFVLTCASRAIRALGPSTRPIHVRHCLVTAPRLDLSLAIWAELMRETEEELDTCEASTPATVGELLRARRDQIALSALLPVLEGLHGGSALSDTAERLHEAAQFFTEHTIRLRAA